MTCKKGLLVVSFGTSYAQTCQKNIEVLENALATAMPDRKLYRAWTSGMIIRKIAKRDGIAIDTVPQALERMMRMGYNDILVQPTHILNGIENDIMLAQIEAVCGNFASVRVGDPLLTTEQDIVMMANLVGKAYVDREADTALVLMGHGSEHEANSVYTALDQAFVEQGYENVHVGTVEAHPDLQDIAKLLAEKEEITKVILAPFMIVAGDHATNDMAGDDEDSWKTVLSQAGYEVTCMVQGLGELSGVADLFVAHATEE